MEHLTNSSPLHYSLIGVEHLTTLRCQAQTLGPGLLSTSPAQQQHVEIRAVYFLATDIKAVEQRLECTRYAAGHTPGDTRGVMRDAVPGGAGLDTARLTRCGRGAGPAGARRRWATRGWSRCRTSRRVGDWTRQDQRRSYALLMCVAYVRRL